MIKLFPITEFAVSPFGRPDDARFLGDRDIALTDNPDECDLLFAGRYPLAQWGPIASHWPGMKLWRCGLFKRPMLIWSPEPRWCLPSPALLPARGIYPDRHVMSVYTGDIYHGNITIFGRAVRQHLEHVTDPHWRKTDAKPVAAMLTYVRRPNRFRLLHDGANIDLVALRQRMVVEGARAGHVDIYGHDWPGGMSLGDTRWTEDWRDQKRATLEKYRFNICLENTTYPYYCTEKIWDAITVRCLPVYWGRGNRIHDDFPEGSYVDAADFETSAALYDGLLNMPDDEYLLRLNRCVDVYNRMYDTNAFERQQRQMLTAFADKVRAIVAS